MTDKYKYEYTKDEQMKILLLSMFVTMRTHNLNEQADDYEKEYKRIMGVKE